MLDERLDRQVDERWFNLRFVALHVDDDRRCVIRNRFGDSRRSVGMVAARHRRLAAKLLHGFQNSIIISRDNHALNEFGLLDALEHMLNERLAGAVRHWLAGKAHRIVSSGNDGNCVQFAFVDLRLNGLLANNGPQS